jgi:hypothetical protein
MLTENVHFAPLTIEVGKFIYEGGGRPWGYCYDNFDGRAQVMRLVHPDVDPDTIAQHGEYLRKLRIARNQKSKRLANREAKD